MNQNTQYKQYECLDEQAIVAAIEPENQNCLKQIEIFPTIDSTNSYLLNKAKAGAQSGSVCLAETQTQGRGRLGKTWVSVAGANIYCSLLWRFTNTNHLAGLSIAIAVMVATVLRKYGIQTGIQLKWPNDVLFDQRKLAGILLERSGQAATVIGIGLNLHAPEEHSDWIGVEAILDGQTRRNYLVGLLLNELLEQLPLFESAGLEPFLSAWERHDYLKGKAITVTTPQKIIEGTAEGITPQGELILLDAYGARQTFCYGEVSARIKPE